MRLKLTLNRSVAPDAVDLLVTVDTTVTVGELATTIAQRDPRRAERLPANPTLRVDDGQTPTVLPPDVSVADAGLRSGQMVTVCEGAGRFVAGRDAPAVATLHVLDGPDAGRSFPLRSGANHVGRDSGNDIVLTDPLVSKQHARINVGETVEIIDLGSANGVLLGDELAPRCVLQAEDTVVLGDSAVRVQRLAGGGFVGAAGGVEFNRSPRLDEVYEGLVREGPEPPQRPDTQRIPFIPLIAPVFMGLIMFAVTRQLVTVLFVAMSPIMMLGNVLETRIFGKRAFQEAVARFRDLLMALEGEMSAADGVEATVRRREHPILAEVLAGAYRREPVLWSRRSDQRGFLEVRLGVGTLASRSSFVLPCHADTEQELWDGLVGLRDRHLMIPEVPVVASLTDCGSLGIAGPRTGALHSARAVLAALTGLHSPAELVIGAICSSSTAPDWDWLKWLPHVGSDHSPISGDHLSSSPSACVRFASALDDLVEQRRAEATSNDDVPPLPGVVVLIENDAPVERSRLVELAELGRGVGVHLIWIAPSVPDLPAACRVFVDLNPASPGTGQVGYVDGGDHVEDVVIEVLDAPAAMRFARSLAPVTDAGAPLDDDSDLPRSVSLVTLAGSEQLGSAEGVIDRWRTSRSIPAEFAGISRKKDHNLRACVGAAVGQSFVLDLREHGPHALVGGTTGSGKSEFLQSWVLGLALEHSPARVTFLFVDYKGGAAFRECVHLPHTVGLVTDLSPHLVARALASLNAELRYREHLLNKKGVKDLLELERRGDPETPPSLVIVVDEFAALATEVPEFVDGVVNIAQRGRSLGLHLILATQRPAGVIKDNLRANTNLRVALRMADEADSDDVVGTKQAAAFDPAIPGRGIAKVGPGRLLPFQSGYVGGWTSDVAPRPIITIDELVIGATRPWESVTASEDNAAPTGPNDLDRLVKATQAAHHQLNMTVPRKPWLDTLAPMYDLAKMPQSRTDRELIFGIADDPDNQRQIPLSFKPDRDGNMAVFGTGGAGKSGFLRTIAIVAGLGLRGGPCHVYGLDFGARGLRMLESLPHVGSIINAEDQERIQRLLRMLRDTIDERSARYGAVNAGSIDDYRKEAKLADEPRIMLLVDNMAAFRQAYEVGPNARWFDVFQSIASDGRQVGVHVVVSADRPGAVPTALNSVIQRRLVLRLASENDYMTLGVKPDAFEAMSPPGRGFLDELEVQVGVLGGTANTSEQAEKIADLAAKLAATPGYLSAPPIERLVDRVHLGELPTMIDDLPVLVSQTTRSGPCRSCPKTCFSSSGLPKVGRPRWSRPLRWRCNAGDPAS